MMMSRKVFEEHKKARQQWLATHPRETQVRETQTNAK